MRCEWAKCGAEFTPRRGSGGCPQRFCCKAHSTAARVERSVMATVERFASIPEKPCETCGTPWKSAQPQQRFCSTRCRERSRERDPEKKRAISARHTKKAWGTVDGRLRSLLRNRMFYALKGKAKPDSAIRALGCTVEELRRHLEAQFQPGMTWENWRRDGWHIDHVRPLASFDLTDPEQFRAACHYANLQPLWAPDNLSKWCHYGTEFHPQAA